MHNIYDLERELTFQHKDHSIKKIIEKIKDTTFGKTIYANDYIFYGNLPISYGDGTFTIIFQAGKARRVEYQHQNMYRQIFNIDTKE